jgi:hypothetical protein
MPVFAHPMGDDNGCTGIGNFLMGRGGIHGYSVYPDSSCLYTLQKLAAVV